MVVHLLPAMDVCDLAVREGDDQLDGTRAVLVTLLEQLGAERIGEVGVMFDPNVHEAVTHRRVERSPDDDELRVAGVVRAGYRCGDRLVRAALVDVEGRSNG
jgi:molecular chaperone GrpE